MYKRARKLKPAIILLAMLIIALAIACVFYIDEYNKLNVVVNPSSDILTDNNIIIYTPGQTENEDTENSNGGPIESETDANDTQSDVLSDESKTDNEQPVSSADDEPVQSTNPPAVREIEGLVVLTDLDNNFVVDLKYAGEDNIAGKALYPVEVAVVNAETAINLIKANNMFMEKGYRIKIWDAYRPLHVQQALWYACPDPRFIARPADVSNIKEFKPSHNNGMSVDITLVDMDGNEIEMPSGFDEFSEKAKASNPNMSEEAKKNVNLLLNTMKEAGFENYYREWWHFNDVTNKPTPYKDIPLEDFINQRD